MIIAVPVSIGAAFALTERLPEWISRPLGFAIEILAGIPSVVIGLWGLLTFGPFLAKHVYPVIADHMPDVPVLRYFRNPVGTGEGLLTAGIVLGLMIVPIIASTTRDLFLQVPPLPKEGGVGARHDRLGGGQQGHPALGALGHHRGHRARSGPRPGRDHRRRHDRRLGPCSIAPNIYPPFTTIAATILTQLDGAQTDGTGFAVATLAELALVLAVISVAVNLVARLIVNRTGRVPARRSGGA